MAEIKGFSPPELCSGYPRDTLGNLNEFANGETPTLLNWSGYLAFDAEENVWNGGRATFTATRTKGRHPSCPRSSVSSWVGLGGLPRGEEPRPLLQVGFESFGPSSEPHFAAFTETIPVAGEAGPVPLKLGVKPGDRIEALVHYYPTNERVRYWINNKTTGMARPQSVSLLSPGTYFDGSTVDFVDERQRRNGKVTNLANFQNNQWGGVEVRNKVGGAWEVLGHVPRIRIRMTGKGGEGQTLASPSGLGPAKSGFRDVWHYCHE